MKKLIIGMIGLVLVGCGGGQSSQDIISGAITAPVICIDYNNEPNFLEAHFSVPGKNMYQMMQFAFLAIERTQVNKYIHSSEGLFFTTDGTAIAQTECEFIPALNSGDTAPNSLWVYQE